MSFVAGDTRVAVAVGGIDAALTAATSGDVLVLAPGTHTATVAIPTGVTVRSQPGQVAATVLQGADLGMAPWSTVRDLTLVQTGGGDAMFAVSGGAGTRWVESCIMDGGNLTFETTETWVVRNCRFSGGCVIGMDGGVSVTVASCYFTGGLGQIIRNSGNDVYVYNCTFSGAAVSGLPVISGGGAGNVNKIYNNVFNLTGADTAVISSVGGTDTIYGNYSTYNLGPSGYGTIVSDLKLAPSGYPLHDSPVRIGNAGESGDYILDFNYLPFSASRSAGAFQWHDDASALYRPRYVDPLDGFDFTFDSVNLDIAPGRTNFHSHLDLAAYMRSYVQDPMHPYFGSFYVTRDGTYKIVTAFGDPFDLTTTGQAASVFGAVALTGADDEALARDTHLAVVPLMDEEPPGFAFSHDPERSDYGRIYDSPSRSTGRYVTVLNLSGISANENPSETSDTRKIVMHFHTGGRVRVYRKYPTVLTAWNISSNPQGYSDMVPDDIGSPDFSWFASMRSFSFDLKGFAL